MAFATLATLHLAVPEAISVIGHDNTTLDELSNPPLTTIDVGNPDLGERLIANMFSVCQGAWCWKSAPCTQG